MTNRMRRGIARTEASDRSVDATCARSPGRCALTDRLPVQRQPAPLPTSSRAVATPPAEMSPQPHDDPFALHLSSYATASDPGRHHDDGTTIAVEARTMTTDRSNKADSGTAASGPMPSDVPAWQRHEPVAIDPIQYKAWCDDKLAAMAGDPSSIQQAAADGVSGSPTTLPHGDAIQASFGHHDVSRIQAHVGGPATDASAQMGAQAYATGNRVAFTSQPDLHLAAHEAAHVVQQRGGVQLKGGVGESGDAYEQHADQVADAVVRGESAAPLLDQMAGSSAAAPAVQRFSAAEHRRMGNDGANNAWVDLDEDYSLPFGEVVALAGDHFSSIEQMRTFARKRNGGSHSRLEIDWARKWKLGVDVAWNDSDPQFRKAREAQESRYYKLAAGNAPNYEGNASHFLNPQDGDTERSTADKATDLETRLDDRTDGSKGAAWTPALAGVGAVASYRMNHVSAIIEAARAGAEKRPIDGALATEAFACHYLTDSFAGGHVRTARQSVKDYWDAKVPMFSTNIGGYMAQEIARYLRRTEADVKIKVEMPLIDVPRVPSFNIYPDADNFSESTVYGEAHNKVSAAFAAQAKVSFGDAISGALHDWDNAKGVTAHVHGKQEVLRGDGHAFEAADKSKGEADNNTGRLATQAVALSVSDIYKAKQLGATMSAPQTIAALFDTETRLFAAEEFLPTVTKDDAADTRNEEIEWKVGSVEELLRMDRMRAAIAMFLKEQAGEIKKLKTSFPGAEGKAIEELAATLESNPEAALIAVINWTPSSASDGVGRRSQAMGYVRTAEGIKGGMESLTPAQRAALLRDLIVDTAVDFGRGPEVIWKLLDGMDETEATHVIPAVGWDKLAQRVGAEKFAARYPKARFG